VNNINAFGRLGEEGRDDGWGDASGVDWSGRRDFGDVAGEDVVWSIEVIDELEVVDFGGGATIAVFPDD